MNAYALIRGSDKLVSGGLIRPYQGEQYARIRGADKHSSEITLYVTWEREANSANGLNQGKIYSTLTPERGTSVAQGNSRRCTQRLYKSPERGTSIAQGNTRDVARNVSTNLKGRNPVDCGLSALPAKIIYNNITTQPHPHL